MNAELNDSVRRLVDGAQHLTEALNRLATALEEQNTNVRALMRPAPPLRLVPTQEEKQDEDDPAT